jgi:hypothetical protein
MFSTQRRIIIAIVIVVLLTVTGVVASIGLPYESAKNLSGSAVHPPVQR